MSKVYCSECVYYMDLRPEAHLDHCDHPDNNIEIDTYKESKNRDKWTPEEKNKANDCPLFKEDRSCGRCAYSSFMRYNFYDGLNRYECHHPSNTKRVKVKHFLRKSTYRYEQIHATGELQPGCPYWTLR